MFCSPYKSCEWLLGFFSGGLGPPFKNSPEDHHHHPWAPGSPEVGSWGGPGTSWSASSSPPPSSAGTVSPLRLHQCLAIEYFET